MDPTVILLGVVLIAFIVFQIYSSKRRKAQADERATTILPGVEVMTTAGVYGTLISLDTEENVAMIEVAPNVVMKFHSQAIRHAVTPEAAVTPDDAMTPEDAGESVEDSEHDGPQLNTSNAVPADDPEPEFGERAKKSPRKKPSSDSK